jgi:dihydroneopterin aldolase
MYSDRIRLANMVFYGHHGAQEAERALGQRFEVDVDMVLDFDKAASEDRLELCVDYGVVYQKIQETVTEKKFYLIEALAHHIAHRILQDFDIQEVTVRVRKPSVPIKGSIDHVEVEMTRKR